MTIKCPDCGSVIDIDRLKEAKIFREIVEIYKSLVPLEAGLIDEYVGCFRASAHAQMPSRKYLRILKETSNLLNAGQFKYGKYTYSFDRELALEAMQKTADTEKRAFRNHNYWKVIIIGLLKKRGAIEEGRTEEEKAARAGEREVKESLPRRGVQMPGWVKEKIGI